MKNLIIWVFIISIAFFSCRNEPSPVYVQNENFQVVEKVKINIDNVKDLEYDGSNFFILTDDKLYTLDKKGKIINLKSVKNIEGLSYDRNSSDLLLINNKMGIKVAETDSILLKSDTISMKDRISMFLAYYNNNYYTVILYGDRDNFSYSSRIVSIDSQGKETFLTPMVGWPSGLDYYDDHLWYLSTSGNVLSKDAIGTLSKYKKTKKDSSDTLIYLDFKLISDDEIPVKGTVGLSIDENGFIYIYSRQTEEIVKLREK